MSATDEPTHPSPSRRVRAFAAVLGITLVGFSACTVGEPFESDGGASAAGAGNGESPAGGAGGGGADGVGAAAGGAMDALGGAPTLPEAGAAGSPLSSCGADRADCNADPSDGCETPLDTAENCGKCGKLCAAPTAPYCMNAAGQYTCVNPAHALVEQRLEAPCFATLSTSELCESVANHTTACPAGGRAVKRTFTMGGQAGVVYDVTLRIRGVLEPKIYTGGTASPDHFYVGGSPKATNYNVYRLAISAPAQTYFLNSAGAAAESYNVFPLDHTKVIQIKGGTTVTLDSSDPDCAEVRNCQSFEGTCQPYVIADIAPAPAGYNGQFVQLDVVSVTVAK